MMFEESQKVKVAVMTSPINDDEDGDVIGGYFVGEERVSDAPKPRNASCMR